MAGRLFSYTEQVTPGANPDTIAQFLIASNTRALLHAISFQPLGATGATAPLVWQLGVQADAGTASDDSASIVKAQPECPGNILTTVRNAFTVEPASTAVKHTITLHQQSSMIWRPPQGPIVMEETLRWGLVYACAVLVEGVYQFHMEE